MKNSANTTTSGASTIMHSIIVPLFALIFTIYYKPHGVYEFLQTEQASFAFNVTILFCIVLVTVSILRGWLYLIGKYRKISKTAYLAWCMRLTQKVSFCFFLGGVKRSPGG